MSHDFLNRLVSQDRREVRMRKKTRRVLKFKPQWQQDELESRLLLATVTWDGGAGNWNWSAPANWNGDLVPSTSDDVVIPELDGLQTIILDTTTSVKSLDSRESIQIQTGQTFQFNQAIIHGDVKNYGLIELGQTSSTIGTLNVDGNYYQSSKGQLSIDLNGEASSENYDRVRITGSAELGGRMTVISGLNPVIGDSFTLLQANTVVSDFHVSSLPSSTGGNAFEKIKTSSAVKVNVVPTPVASVSDAYNEEGDSVGANNRSISFVISGIVPSGSHNISYRTINGNPGTDYTSTSGSFTASTGSYSQTVIVPLSGNSIDQLDRNFQLEVTTDGANPIIANGLIIDDDMATSSVLSTSTGFTPINTPFDTIPSVTIRNKYGNPVEGSSVSLIISSAQNGATATFADDSHQAIIISNSLGIATSPSFTANSYAGGTYSLSLKYLDVSGRVLTSSLMNLANTHSVVRSGFDANSLPGNDDSYTGSVDIGFPINFFGTSYSTLFVNNNGNVTFGSASGTYNPPSLTTAGQLPRIAPLFYDVDTRNGLGTVTYGTGTIDGHQAFGVTWSNVGYYSLGGNLRNTFQLILVDQSSGGAGNFDMEFNYDQVKYDYNGGARVGYTNGSGDIGTKYEFPGTGTAGTFLDGNFATGLIHNSINSSEVGRYVFPVSNGLVASPTTTTISANKTAFTYGEEVTFTATVVSATATPEGTVIFKDGETTIGQSTLISGTASLTTTLINSGTRNIRAEYLGSTSHIRSSSDSSQFLVSKRAVQIKSDNVEKRYGDSDPDFTFAIINGTLANNDPFSGNLSRAIGENIGSYQQTLGTLTLGNNYLLSIVPGTLVIDPRPITVAADYKVKERGESDPSFSHHFTSGNLVTGDTLTGELTRQPGEELGNYVISRGSLSAGSNYVLTFTNSSLDIVEGLPTTLNSASGNGQSSIVYSDFALALKTKAVNRFGFPVSGVSITFAAPSSGATGSFAGGVLTAVTGADGVATSPVFTANTVAGNYVVTASASGLTPVSFNLTNTAGAATNLAYSSGSGQSAKINMAFALPLKSVVTDTYGNPVSGVTVTFAAPTNGASATFAGGTNTAVSGADGVAQSVVLTANSVAGSYSVTASATGLTGTPSFTLTNTPDVASSVTIIAGNNQSTVVNTAFGTALKVKVTDGNGNAVPGVTVTFAAPSTGASGAFTGGVTTAVSDASGFATAATFTANTAAGAYSVSATVDGLTPVNFSLTNTAGAAANMAVYSGNNQSAMMTTAFTNPLAVLITDTYGNPISGTAVTFNVPGSGPSATFAGNVNTATSNANGIATSVGLTANNIGGNYSVSASATGLTTQSFSLTNAAPTVTAFVVQKGSVGRSFLRYVDLGFDTSTTLSDIVASIGTTNPRIRMKNTGLDGTQDLPFDLNSKVSAVDAVLAMNFGVEGIGGNRNTAAGDGSYLIELDLDNNGSFETSRRFFRLLGDVNGDKEVNATDSQIIAWNIGLTGSNVAADANGDGVVNALDNLLVRRQRGRKITV